MIGSLSPENSNEAGLVRSIMQKVKVFSRRLVHPFFWTKNIIMWLVFLQIMAGSFFILYVLYGEKKPDKKHVKKSLQTQRQLIRNLKLANLQEYVWKPFLSCKDLLSTKIYSEVPVNEKNCIPMGLKFVKVQKIFPVEIYYASENTAKIYYNERIDKPCLICHQDQKADTLVHWSYNTSPAVASALLPDNFNTLKTIERYTLLGLVSIFLFWLVYSMVRFLLYKLGRLDTLAVSFFSEDRPIPQNFLRKIALKRSALIYGELGDRFFRGYIPKVYFLKWLTKLTSNRSDALGKAFSNIKTGVLHVRQSFGLEGIRICQAVTRKVEPGRFLLEYGILFLKDSPDPGQDARKVAWRLRSGQIKTPNESKKIQFIDFRFDSMTDYMFLPSGTVSSENE